MDLDLKSTKLKMCNDNESKEKKSDTAEYFLTVLKRSVRREVYKDSLIKSYLRNRKLMLANAIAVHINPQLSKVIQLDLIQKFLFETLHRNTTILSTRRPTYAEIENVVETVLTKILSSKTFKNSVLVNQTVGNIEPDYTCYNHVIESIAHETYQTIIDHIDAFTNYKEKLITALTENYSNFYKILTIGV